MTISNDASRVVAVGDSGLVWRSADGGLTWQSPSSGVSPTAADLYAVEDL